MEPNESNLKPQPTGGLKLMTVFIAVLALHVVVIGGFTVWHLLYPSSTDADLTLDKTHKNKIVTDSSIADMPGDTTGTDKAMTPATTASTTPDSSTSAADSTSATATPATSADATAATTESSASAPAPSADSTAAATPVAPAPVTTPAPPTMAEDASAAAANPPAATPKPVASTATPPAAATTSDLAPPADASSAPAADSTPAAPAVAEGTSYTVKRGDSLARIARRHHITLAELRAANSLKSDRLHIAQVLVLPDRAPKAAPADADAEALATPAPDATTSGPTPDSNTADASSSSATPSNAPAPAAQSLAGTMTPHHAHKLAMSTHHLYTVVKGDTLTRIARRYHTTTSAIVAANGLVRADRLSIGQKLHIPSHEARTAEDKPIQAEPHGANRAQLANNL